MITHALDWLDEAAGGLIRLAYLLAGVTAVAVYFGAGHLPRVVADALDGALPWVLSFAVETHTYTTSRRVRSAWQDMQAATHGAPEWQRALGALRVNLGILAVLLAFSAWNQLNYLYATWTPPATAFALPAWVAYAVRALIVPGAFMAAAFLAPLAAPIAAQVEAEARATLADVFRIARRQRRKMLQQAERDGRDMTAALVQLVEDPAARRIIAHAYGAIGSPILAASGTSAQAATAEQERGTYPGEPAAKVRAVPVEPSAPDRPPTGPGTPSVVASSISPRLDRRASTPAVLRLANPDAAGARRRTAARAQAGSVRTSRSSSRRGGAGRIGESVEPRARAVWQPGMSIEALQTAAAISRASAQKYAAMFAAEDAARAGQLAQ